MPNGLVIPGGVTWPLLAPDGTAAAPSYSFANDPNTGMYSAGADALGFSAGGTLRLTVATAGITATVPMILPDGTAAAPALSGSDADTGVFFAPSFGGEPSIQLTTNGTARVVLRSTIFHMAGTTSLAWAASTVGSTVDLYLTRHSAANLRQGAAAAADADGVAQTLRSPGGGTVSAGTTGRNGGAYTIRAGDGSAAKAGSGANGGIGGDLTLQAGGGGAGDGAGVAGADGTLIFATAGAGRWYVSSGGHFKANATNTYDIGATAGASCPRSIYAGTSFLAPDGAAATPSIAFSTTPGTGLYYINSTSIGVSTGALVRFAFSGVDFKVGPTGLLGFGSASALSSADVALARLAAASLRLGLAPSATPIAQTFTIGEASRPGTDANVGGASGTICSGLGTGTGTVSTLIFQTPTVAASGSGVQSYATRLTIDSSALTPTVTIHGPNGTAADPTYSFTNLLTSGLYMASTGPAIIGMSVGGTARLGFSTTGIIHDAAMLLMWSSTTPTGAVDLSVARLGAASLRLGAAPSATPIAQTFTLGEASRPGTDANVGGASGTIASGLGTGTGTASSLIFQTPTLAGAGSGVQALATRLTIATAAVTSTVQFLGADGVVGAPGISFATDTSTGMWRPSGSVLSFAVAATERFRFVSAEARLGATGIFGWTSAGPSSSLDLGQARLAAASLRLGLAPSATPIAQVFTIGEASRPGTDVDISGANGTIRSGLGTGVSAGSSLFFQTATPVATGSTTQTYTTRLTLSALGATFDIPDQSFRINNQVTGAGAAAGTITNAPVAGNPSFWLPINVGGTVYFFPGW